MLNQSDKHSSQSASKKVRSAAKSALNTRRQGQGQGQIDRAAYEQRKRARAALSAELDRIEAIERAILVELGHPADDLHAVLDRIQESHQIRSKHRKAFFAVQALLRLKDLRVEMWGDDPARAAVLALRVGAYAGDVLHEALSVPERRSQGKEAQQTRQRAKWQDWQIALDKLRPRRLSALAAETRILSELKRPKPKAGTIRKLIGKGRLKYP